MAIGGGAPAEGAGLAPDPVGVPWRPVLLIVLIGAALRYFSLWLLAGRLPFLDAPVGDAGAWLAQAASLRSSGGPNGPWFDPAGPPAWMGLFLSLARPGLGVALAQVAIGAVIALLAAVLAARLFGRREALLAALLVTLSSSMAFFEVQPLEAIPAALLALLATLFHLWAEGDHPAPRTREERLRERRRVADGWRAPRPSGRHLVSALVSGAAFGGLALLQPGFLLAGPIVGLVLLARALGGRRHPALAAVLVAGWFVALLPLLGPNVRFGAPVAWPTGAGVRVYLANRPDGPALPAPRPPDFTGTRLALPAEADSFVIGATGRSLGPGPAFGWWSAAALRDIGMNLPAWAALEARKLHIFASRIDEEPGASAPLELERVPHRRLLALPPHFFLGLGLVGFVLAAGLRGFARGGRASLVPLVVLTLLAVGAALLEWPLARIRLAVLPLLAVLSAHALVRADDLWRGGVRRPVVVTGVLLLVGLAAGWTSPAGPWRRPAHEASLLAAAAATFEARGDSLAADRWLEEAVDLDPGNVDVRLARSRRALARRDLGDAVLELERAREAAPGDVTVRNNLGILYVQVHRFDEADRELQAAIALDPSAAGPWYYRGHVARAALDLPAAITYYRETLRRDPRYGNAWARLVAALIDAGRMEEAREEADRATQAAIVLPKEVRERLGF